MKYVWVCRYQNSQGDDIDRDVRIDHTCALFERDSNDSEDITVVVALFAMTGKKVWGIAEVCGNTLPPQFDTGLAVPEKFIKDIQQYYTFQ